MLGEIAPAFKNETPTADGVNALKVIHDRLSLPSAMPVYNRNSKGNYEFDTLKVHAPHSSDSRYLVAKEDVDKPLDKLLNSGRVVATPTEYANAARLVDQYLENPSSVFAEGSQKLYFFKNKGTGDFPGMGSQPMPITFPTQENLVFDYYTLPQDSAATKKEIVEEPVKLLEEPAPANLFEQTNPAKVFGKTGFVEQFNRQKNQNANGGFIKLQDGDEVKKNLVRPREKPPVPAIGSLASLKDTPREQRFMSSQDADTQALTDTFLAEQQRGPDETELDQIVEGIAKQSAAAAVGYGDGKALYGMPNMKGRGLDSLGIASPEAKKVIETAPSFASSLSSFIPEDREGLWTAVVNMGKQSNIVKGLSNTEYKTIRHELEHLAYKKIPKVYDLFGELESKYGTPFGKSGENEETFIRVKDYMEAYANEDKERMEKAKEFLEEHDPVRFKHKNDKFTPLDFYNKNKHIFDAVDRLSQVYLKNSGGKLAGMTPETKYSEKELQVKGMAPKGFFDLRAASKEVRKLYDESIRIMTESPTSDFIQQEERSDGGFIN